MTEREKFLTRRGFIRSSSALGAGVALGPLVLDLSGCGKHTDVPDTSTADSGSESDSDSQARRDAAVADGGGSKNESKTETSSRPRITDGGVIEAGEVLLGLYQGSGEDALHTAASRLDFSWLKSGDTVLIKVATNSGNKHPSTTCPNGVKAMIAELKSRGAGKVIVADQSGVEHVRSSKQGRSSKTNDMWMTAGLLDAVADADTHFFDDQSFDDGYFSATLPDDNHWPRGMYLPQIIKQVDHIIYMPRIGTHVLAGNTIGHKCAIGWLRDDSRHDLHNDAEKFYEKYTEVNYTKEIRDRFRMVVTVSEAVLLHGGPDSGTVYALDPVMVTASTTLANHDAVGVSVLVTMTKNVPASGFGTENYNAAFAPQANVLFAGGFGVATGAAGNWVSGSPSTTYTAHAFEQGVTKDRAVSHGWELSGGKPDNIKVAFDGEPIDDALMQGLMTHGEGLYDLG